MSYNFLTDRIEVRNKDKKFWVKAYATLMGDNVDDKNSIITQTAKNKMLSDMMRSDIAVDVEHDAVATGRPNLLPVAKIRTGNWDKVGLITNIEVNNHSPQFPTTWGSLKDGFLDALSVEFIPKKVHEEFIDGSWFKVIDDLELKGMAFTGRSATSGTNILEVFTRSANEFSSKNGEVNETKGDFKMEEEKKVEEQQKAEESQKEEVVVKSEGETEVKAEPSSEKEGAKVVERIIEKEKTPEEVKKKLADLEEENKKLKDEKEKSQVSAESIVKQEDKYGINKPEGSETKSDAEKLDDMSMKDLMKEAIEKDAYKG